MIVMVVIGVICMILVVFGMRCYLFKKIKFWNFDGCDWGDMHDLGGLWDEMLSV